MLRIVYTTAVIVVALILSCNSPSEKEEDAPGIVGTWMVVEGMGYPKTVGSDSTGNGVIDLGYTQNLYWDICEDELGTYTENVDVHGIGNELSEARVAAKRQELEGVELMKKESIALHESESAFSFLDGEGKETSMVRYELDEDTAVIHYSDVDAATCSRTDRVFGDREEEGNDEE